MKRQMCKCELTVMTHHPRGRIVLVDETETPPQNSKEVKYGYVKTKDEWENLYSEIVEANPHYRDRFHPTISCYYGRRERADIAEEMLIEEIEDGFERRFGKPFNIYWQMTDDEFKKLDKEVQEWMEY